MTATVRTPEVAAFVDDVRRALDDLTPDEVDDLTGGLEADLDDAVREGGVAVLRDPAAYAAELRAAAGLPARSSAPTTTGARAVTRVRHAVDAVRRRLDAHPLWPPVRDVLVVLRPAWWLARAWVAYQLLTGTFGTGLQLLAPYGGPRWVVFLALCVASVELGRRRVARRGPWFRRGAAVLNTVAALLLLPLFAHTQASAVIYTSTDTVYPPPNGLWLNGREVRNVFPYDAQGNPLVDVQLYDENGKPLEVGTSARTPLSRPDAVGTAPSGSVVADGQVPAVDANNRPVWNVYPLRQQELDEGMADAGGQGVPLTSPSPAPLPMRLAPVVQPPRAAVGPTPAAAASPSP